MTSPDSIIVLGKTVTTPAEDDALSTLGYFIAKQEQQLLTTPSAGAPMAVGIGYFEGGGTPKMLERGDLPHDDVIVIFDDALGNALDKRLPDWMTRPWIVVRPERLDDFVSMYITVLHEKGHDLVA